MLLQSLQKCSTNKVITLDTVVAMSCVFVMVTAAILTSAMSKNITELQQRITEQRIAISSFELSFGSSDSLVEPNPRNKRRAKKSGKKKGRKKKILKKKEKARNNKKPRKNDKNKRKGKKRKNTRKDDRHRGKKKQKRNKPKKPTFNVMHLEMDKKHRQLENNNGLLVTEAKDFLIPFWKVSDHQFNHEQRFGVLNHGVVTIQQKGMYMIYTQMTFFDGSGKWSYMIAINDKPFIKCLASEWGIKVDPDSNRNYKTIHQCYTSSVTFINSRSDISVRTLYPERAIHMDKEMTFWGIIKLTG